MSDGFSTTRDYNHKEVQEGTTAKGTFGETEHELIVNSADDIF